MKNMYSRRRACVVMLVVFLAVPPLLGQSPTRTLKVKVAYTGEGKVDAANGIHLFLFDSPNISEGSMPIGWTSVFKNDDVAVFSGLTARVVYLVSAYGESALMGPPSPGTPVSRYRPDDAEGPTPIELVESETEIELTFDDSFRMP